MFSPSNKLRLFLYRVSTNKRFEKFIIFTIIVSCVVLAIDSPLIDPKSKTYFAVGCINKLTTFIFSVEAVFKIIANGFLFCGEKSYFKNKWNVLDFFLVLFSVLSDTPLSNTFSIFKIFRIVRPIRLIG
jgi:voltage-dependent calcium channel L type alpha-1D